jgi:uncharacterized protein DUF4399
MKYSVLLLIIFMATGIGWAATSAAQGATVYIISPQSGEIVQSPVTVKFGLKGMGVAPAGIDKANTGHHHLLIDIGQLPAMDAPIPANDKHRHFGGGQTEIELELSPGQHTLQLLLGDKSHIPHDTPLLSERITITVN